MAVDLCKTCDRVVAVPSPFGLHLLDCTLDTLGSPRCEYPQWQPGRVLHCARDLCRCTERLASHDVCVVGGVAR